MRKRVSFPILLITATIIFLLAAPTAAFAASWQSNNAVTIPSEKTIHDDLYVGGQTITIDGNIDGNLFIGGGNIIVNGNISKSLFVGGGTVTIAGDVGDIALVGGGQITISGRVKNDLLVGGGTVNISKNARIGRDLLLGAGTVTMGGEIGRNMLAGATDLTMTGTVTRNVRFEGDKLLVDKGARIGGDLTYYSANKASISSEATVGGKTTYHHVTKQNQKTEAESGASMVFGLLLAMFWFFIFLIGRLIVGLVLAGVAPRAAAFSIETLKTKPWQCLGVGLGVLVVIPMVCLGLAVTLVGLPLAMILLNLYIFAIYASMFVTGLFLGHWLLSLMMKKEPHPMASVLLGVIILAFVTAIPFIGWLISLASVTFGTGTLAFGLVALLRAGKVKPV